ncbi:MAG: FMN-binding protein [Eubacteriales bacterium]|nr:FMN-binding protein [Eubacteriales bacterium]
MLFLATLLAVVVVSISLSLLNLKRIAPIFYAVAIILNLVGIYFSFAHEESRNVFLMISRLGLVGTAFLVVVMYIGALPTKGIIKKLLRIRGELSILGVLFMLNHFAYYIVKIIQGMDNWSKLAPKALTINLFVSVLSLWAWALCIPLFITSFRAVRNKMNGKRWKALQRYAYFFYIIVYVHIIFAFINKPNFYSYHVEVIIYSAVFMLYICLRLLKYMRQKNALPAMKGLAGAVTFICILGFAGGVTLLETGHADYVVQEARRQEELKRQEEELKRQQEELQRQMAERDKEEEASPTEDAEEYYLNDGSFIGKAPGYNGEVQLKVDIKRDRILNIETVQNPDDAEYVRQAQSLLTNIMLNNGTESVDVVSGATVTSIAFIKATEDAINQAVKE